MYEGAVPPKNVVYLGNHSPEGVVSELINLKGTVARDFWPLVFFMNRPHMGL